MNKNTGKYTNLEGKEQGFIYVTELTIGQKINFVVEVANMIVSKELGYIPLLKGIIFDYCLLKYFTDIEIFIDDNEFQIDLVEEFMNKNKSVINDVKENIKSNTVYNELVDNCDKAIEFRKAHFSDYKEEISDLLQVVREFVVKPDRMNDVLEALANWLNSAAGKEIDMNMVDKLIKIIPAIQDMDNKEVAKAIIEEQHKNSSTGKKADKPKSNRSRKPKDKTDSNIGSDIVIIK